MRNQFICFKGLFQFHLHNLKYSFRLMPTPVSELSFVFFDSSYFVYLWFPKMPAKMKMYWNHGYCEDFTKKPSPITSLVKDDHNLTLWSLRSHARDRARPWSSLTKVVFWKRCPKLLIKFMGSRSFKTT